MSLRLQETHRQVNIVQAILREYVTLPGVAIGRHALRKLTNFYLSRINYATLRNIHL